MVGFFDKISTIRYHVRNITDGVISKRDICSKIMIYAPNMHKGSIIIFQKAKGNKLVVGDPKEEICKLYRMYHLQNG